MAEHLQAVARLASDFAAPFGAQHFASVAGLLHDLGKYTLDFQERIRGSAERVDHATWGAKFAIERFGPLGYLIAYAIAGHHAGLANGEAEGTRSPLQRRIAATLPALQATWRQELDVPEALATPQGMAPRSKDHRNFTAAFLVRMLFSCLVDADYLDTEAFYAHAEGREVARACNLGIPTLQAAVTEHLASVASRARPSTVNVRRQHILEHVRGQAALPPGLFSLTVPTGGGKTLTSLAFSLDHAVKHQLRRVIYVIPYTSIVEQNAQVIREALGPLGESAVLEHHSAYIDDPTKAREAKEKTQLAMENWDAPVVVTTAVQFFESLFGDRPSQCRKLHNIAGSVITLDEAQTLPLKLLRPTLLALDELARNYKCTIVFCTATQPALADDGFRDVLGPLHELAPDPVAMFQAFKRVTVQHLGPLSDDDIAARMAAKHQALCIVNNRLHARALYQRLESLPGTWHLSTLMCARHRSDILDRVRQALRTGEPCRLISTSLIEAGVDVSFPMVMRAEAGLDSVAQAAGRCNREGLWASEDSDVLVFAPDTEQWKPPRELTQFAAVGGLVLRRHADDPLSPQAIKAYFQELYWTRGTQALDEKDLLGLMRGATLQSLPFEDLSRAYRLIDSVQETVLIPFDKVAEDAIAHLKFAAGIRGLSRTLQPYSVQVPRSVFQRLFSAGAIQACAAERLGDQFMQLANMNLYDKHHGLFWEDPTFIHAAQLVQ